MSYWLKLIYNRTERSSARDWRDLTWISDAHRRNAAGEPSFRPSYKVGDEILVYSIWDSVCPARLSVTKEAVFDPDRVNKQGFAGDGSRWGWLTETRVLESVELDAAPTLLELEIDPMSVRQQDHNRLTERQYALAGRAVRPGARPRPARRVPVEERHVESYEQRYEKAMKTAYREEQKLVQTYKKHLEARGRTVYRHRLSVPDGTGPLYTDLFEEDRSNLVEAKARISRPSVRMAIGQLADYARLISPRPKHRAVLLSEKPSSDLIDLLDSQSIKVVWRHGRGFSDNASGALT